MSRRFDFLHDPELSVAVKRVAEALRLELSEDPFLGIDGRHLEIVESGAVTNKKIPHGLGYIPKDVIQTWKTGAGAITWNYASFDKTNIDITTTGACVVRAIVGRYGEG